MIQGITLFKLAGSPIYSLPFPRLGGAALFSVNVEQVANTPTLTLTVQHKNVDETTWGDAGAFSAITTTGVTTLNQTDLKEEVRYKFEIAGASATAGVHLFMDRPAWRPS